MSSETILITGAAGSVGSTAHTAMQGCSVVYFAMSISPSYLEAAANVAVTAKSLGVKAFVNLSRIALHRATTCNVGFPRDVGSVLRARFVKGTASNRIRCVPVGRSAGFRAAQVPCAVAWGGQPGSHDFWSNINPLQRRTATFGVNPFWISARLAFESRHAGNH